ncbi:MAG: pyrroline-5-carboxylate reductase [Dactylosporangium sp.]|nr:pyrroline-5-carboxylate reductase [Dactylosporangium sp.]NNJ62102.1 pyrroline-5-carboxylate reductase [Dactylosporangium sp.]
MRTIAIIGAGKMGEALLSGLLRAGWDAGSLLAVDASQQRARELTERYGIRFVSSEEAVDAAEVVVLAVKPQDAHRLLTHVGARVSQGTLVVSICAGLPTTFFATHLPEGTPIVRVMPNTPALVAEGMTAISPGEHATAADLDLVEELFQQLGRVVRVPETQQDAVTALSGSGPAYFFYLVEAMTEAGVMLGLPRQVAHDLTVQTAVGSAAMLRDTGESPATLREAVTSPGGTTIAALRELDRHAVRAAVFSAVEAARDRASGRAGRVG